MQGTNSRLGRCGRAEPCRHIPGASALCSICMDVCTVHRCCCALPRQRHCSRNCLGIRGSTARYLRHPHPTSFAVWSPGCLVLLPVLESDAVIPYLLEASSNEQPTMSQALQDSEVALADFVMAVLDDDPALESVAADTETSPTGDDRDDTTLELCFNEAGNSALNLPNGYLEVSVLIVSWTKELDHLMVEDEVSPGFLWTTPFEENADRS
jgi:hypothetical protein